MQQADRALAQALAFKDGGALEEALVVLSALLHEHPGARDALKLSAELHFRLGRREAAFAAALRAYELDPADIRYGLDCTFNLIKAGRRTEALRVANEIAAQSTLTADHHDFLGTAFTYCEAPEKALPHFQRACAAEPGSAAYHYNLATAQQMLRMIEPAETSLSRALGIDAMDGGAHLLRSSLRRQTQDSNHIEELRQALRRAPGRPHQITLGFALAKELEDLGRYRESFECLSAAATLQRATLQYDPTHDLDIMRALRGLDYSTLPRPHEGAASLSHRPIFVVGLPRTGTTLVDRIIRSVPGLHGKGETNGIAAEISRVAGANGRSGHTLDAMLRAIRQHAGTITDRYAHSHGGSAGDPYTDKTPTHYLFAGLIARAFPEARMICLRRDPMDACYAMYKTYFRAGYPFSYDLEELADYYAEWQRLVSHWEATLGDRWLSVRYEDIVQRPEPTMRRIVSHCGLGWNARCLRFHELATPVTTASAAQVTLPLHTKSIGLWRNYTRELEPLRLRLLSHGIATG